VDRSSAAAGVRGARVVAALLAGCLALLAAAPLRAEEKPGGEATRATMRELFESIRVLLPLSVRWEDFQSPQQRDAVLEALRRLNANAAALPAHLRPEDPGFRHLGRSLERDAEEALREYERGRYAHAEFLVLSLTEYCVACHSRLPSPGDSPVASHFVEGSALASLPAAERAGLQIATRQFDAALGTYEALLGEAGHGPGELLDPLTDYLIVALRVKQDPARPIPTLERFAKRPDLRRYLRLDVKRWIADLRRLAGQPPAEPDLAVARRLLDEARDLIAFPGDRRALVQYVAASDVLYRWIDAQPQPGPESAEAYYLLGLVESRIGRDRGASPAGFYLENAIRLAPKAPFAELAYAVLEEETLLDYGAVEGEELPADVAQRLAELERLLDQP
jgi:hypothetical protein